MKYLVILILLPFAVFSQKQSNFWVTPIADIEFRNNKIVYIYSKDMPVSFCNIKPVFYLADIMSILPGSGAGYLDDKDFRKLNNQIDEYLENWTIHYANNREEFIFLKSCCLKIIWSIGAQKSLPENAINALQVLKDDLNIETSQNAKLVIKLYNEMKK